MEVIVVFGDLAPASTLLLVHPFTVCFEEMIHRRGLFQENERETENETTQFQAFFDLIGSHRRREKGKI